MKLRASLLVVLFGSACATTGEKKGEAPAPVTEQQRIVNLTSFDLATCFPRTLELPEPPNKAAVTGFLVAARPQIAECLVPPENRGPAENTTVQVQTTVSTTGAQHQISGENLTDAGKACVEKALAAQGTIPALKDGAEPVVANFQMQHVVGVSPSVRMGVNEASDVAGTIRLAEPTMCDCFEPIKDAPPLPMRAQIALSKTQPTPASVTFTAEPKNEAERAAQTCLQSKLMAMEIPHTSEQLTVPYTFVLLNSGLEGALPESTPELNFLQLEAVRGQRAADAAIALGGRANAVAVYDAKVTSYQKNPKSVTVKELKDRCADLLTADDKLIAALDAQQKVEQETVTLLGQLQAKDPAYAEAATAAQTQAQATTAELDRAKQQRTGDAGACPRER